MHRITIQFNDATMSRLEQLQEESSLPSLQSVLLSAFANYRLDIKPIAPKKTAVKAKTNKKELGEGPRAKDLNEVIKFFKGKVAEPVAPKAKIFFDHYQANGWKQGGNKPLKMWGCALTTWLNRQPEWRPVEIILKGSEGLELKDVLQWFHAERPQVFEKYKHAENIGEIDDYYIDEYRQNI